MTRPLSRCLLLSLATACTAASADEDLFFSELPIVASVSRLPQRLADAPSSVTVLDRDTIKASGARSLSDVFRLVPGFQTFAQSDTAARLSYHGVTDDNDYSPRAQVLVDGRSLHSPLFRGGMNWALVPVALEDIERIEVVRGSNNTSYGTNAFLGVINIITVDPALVKGVSLSTNQGSQGVRDYTLRTGGSLGESGSFRLTYQQARDDGLEDAFDWRDNNRNRLLDLRANFQAGTRDALEFQLGRVEGTQTYGRLATRKVTIGGKAVKVLSGGVDEGNPIRDFDQSSSWLQGRWLHTLSETSDFSLRYTYSVDRGDDAFRDPDRPAGYDKVDEMGDVGWRHEVEAVHSFMPFAATRLIWGGSWRYDTLRSETMLRGLGTVSRDVGRVFTNGEWKPSDWFTGNLGWSYEHDSLAGEHPAYRASASFHPTPGNTVRIGYARSWRTASITDYRGHYLEAPDEVVWQGNRGLPTERLDSWELGYLGDWRERRMSLDVRLFREWLTNRNMHNITASADAPDSVYALQDMRMSGVEYQWKWQPFEKTRLALGQAFIRVDSDLTDDGIWLSDPVRQGNLGFPGKVEMYDELAKKSAPRRSTSFLLMQKLPFGFELSVAHYRVAEIKWTRNTDAEKYHRTDARLGYPFRFGSRRGEIAYVGQSLNGEHFEQRMERPVDRRQWVMLRLDF